MKFKSVVEKMIHPATIFTNLTGKHCDFIPTKIIQILTSTHSLKLHNAPHKTVLNYKLHIVNSGEYLNSPWPTAGVAFSEHQCLQPASNCTPREFQSQFFFRSKPEKLTNRNLREKYTTQTSPFARSQANYLPSTTL